jgi:hypothetical protein
MTKPAANPTGTYVFQAHEPFRNGTTQVIFEPLDFIARLAALVPKPRVNLTRLDTVFISEWASARVRQAII